ncbi:probable RNA-binding protein EIF1AD isoform X2 [Spodoptera frugiperda]|uniref:Probable RNA-binding protein EIF1AD n=1 Tax=Spodoptera frugiperda TaxID=7108 RepID=A0A9R0D794_SPOFR|nr:probable RNA-binding protein EIF1AD isoform X2 [Spodoptera frugiperda]
MSRVNKKKHVMNENAWGDEELPKENQTIVKVLETRGNNLHAVTTPTGEEYLVSMPPKFRKNIWVRRGFFMVVEPIPEGKKVKAEVVKVLNANSIKYYKEKDVWPKEFEEKIKEDDEDELFKPCGNRRPISFSESSSDDSSDGDTYRARGSISDSGGEF